MCVCSGDQLHCEVKKVNNTLPPYWQWRAKFLGRSEYRNELVDIWDVTVSCLVQILQMIKLLREKLSYSL